LTHWGTDFWFTFPWIVADSLPQEVADFVLFVTAAPQSPGEAAVDYYPITITGRQPHSETLGTPIHETIRPGETKRIELTQMGEYIIEGSLDLDREVFKSIHVVSDDGAPLSVVVLRRAWGASDAFLAYPTESLGTDYIVLSYPNQDAPIAGSAITVVATQDDTEVAITPSTTIERPSGAKYAANVPYTVKLDAGQVYYIANRQPWFGGDLTGTLIHSLGGPIAVFGSHEKTTVPHVPSGQPYDHYQPIIEQLPPVKAWGKHFVTTPLARWKVQLNGSEVTTSHLYSAESSHSPSDTFRILASESQTTVCIGGDLANGCSTGNRLRLDKAEFVEVKLEQATYITASKPILVAQYSHAGLYDTTNGHPTYGDPTMILVPATSQYLDQYFFRTPLDSGPNAGPFQFLKHHVNVVVPEGTPLSAVRIVPQRFDGSVGDSIPPLDLRAVDGSSWAYARFDVPDGAYTVTADGAPIGAIMYGWV
jgi:hypothetical protein